MKIPEHKALLLEYTKGLPHEGVVIMEKYIETRMGNAEANKLYENGDLYKIFLGSSESMEDEEVVWDKVGTVSSESIKDIKKVVNNLVNDYIRKEDFDFSEHPIESVDWYFFFDEPIYVHSQMKRFVRLPKFVRKINKAIESNFSPVL